MGEQVKLKLDSMTKTVRAVIEVPIIKKQPLLYADFDLDHICDELEKIGFEYALIVHDKDYSKEGVMAFKHVHLVFTSPKRHRLSFYLARLCEIFNCDKNLISVQVSNSYDSDIQYLIHKNNPNKHAYDVSDIHTNISKKELDNRLIREVHVELTSSYVLDVVKSCRTRTHVALKLGLGTYNLYYKIVNDFIRDGWLGYDLNVHSEGELDRIFGK